MPADAELSRRDPDVPEFESGHLKPGVSPPHDGVSAASCRTPTGSCGRILDFLAETGQFDDTLVMVVSDNGASAEVARRGRR